MIRDDDFDESCFFFAADADPVFPVFPAVRLRARLL